MKNQNQHIHVRHDQQSLNVLLCCNSNRVLILVFKDHRNEIQKSKKEKRIATSTLTRAQCHRMLLCLLATTRSVTAAVRNEIQGKQKKKILLSHCFLMLLILSTFQAVLTAPNGITLMGPHDFVGGDGITLMGPQDFVGVDGFPAPTGYSADASITSGAPFGVAIRSGGPNEATHIGIAALLIPGVTVESIAFNYRQVTGYANTGVSLPVCPFLPPPPPHTTTPPSGRTF
jgi:hypothetical protein